MTEVSEGPLLDVRGLTTELLLPEGPLAAVQGASFSVGRKEAVGLVGESGCGKTLTALSLLGLLPGAQFRVSGSARLLGVELVGASEATFRALRGRALGMVFQDAGAALDPLWRVGRQVAEALPPEALRDWRSRVVELFRQVGIAAPEARVDAFPHELSGGMRQRVMIAMALAGAPSLLLADEPTTALDVTVQAQVLDLFKRLQRERSMALLLVTHDLAAVAEACERVVVMYAGRVVEDAPVLDFFAGPAHPYAQGLLASLPARQTRGRPLQAIPGSVPSLRERGQGCPFRGRCARASARCAVEMPALAPLGPGHVVACHHPLHEGARAHG